jgi:DNA-binding CsgD family transcriptional regulator/PAS domain-containing protein
MYDDTSRLASINCASGDDDAWTEKCLGDYGNEFYLYDPGAAAIANWPVGRWLEDQAITTAAQRASSIFYQEFMCPNAVGSISAAFILRDGVDSAILSLLGGPESHGLTNEQHRQCSLLGKHFSRALRIGRQLGQLNARAAVAEATLGQLPVPVFLLDEKRTLLYANAAALALVNSEPALRCSQGRLVAHVFADDAQWRQALARGALMLPRANGHGGKFALMNVPAPSQLGQQYPRPITLMTAPQLGAPGERETRLRAFYGLTASEAQVAIMVCCDGLSPAKCAELREVAIDTVRSQLKSIQAKMGVSRTAELVKIVLGA